MSRGPAVLVAAAIALGGCHDWERLSSTASRCDERCELAGGTCSDSGQCTLSCAGAPCRCPEDHSCVITYTTDTPAAIECTNAAACDVRCPSEGACNGAQIMCGSGSCRVSCTADFACVEFFVTCGTGPCEINCTQDGACAGATIFGGNASSCELECTQQGCPSLNFDCQNAAVCSAACTMTGQLTCDAAILDCGDSPECDLDCNGNEAQCTE